MEIEKIKQMAKRSIVFKVLICIILMAVLVLYFKTFFTKGIYFQDVFLKKEVQALESHYTGKGKIGNIEVVVKGIMDSNSSVEVLYKLPNNVEKGYTVNFGNIEVEEIGIKSIKDREGNVVLSDGRYFINDGYLLSEDYNIISFDDQVLTPGEMPRYEESLYTIASFATAYGDTIRGKYEFLIPAILFLLVTIIDYKFPLFFFSLRNSLSVKNPEPSDLYISMQRISWYVYPLISIILMIAAIY